MIKRNKDRDILTHGHTSGWLYIAILVIFFSWSCTGLKKIPEGQYLVTKNKLELHSKKQINEYADVKNELEGELKPKRMGKFLWMRPRLIIHDMVGEPKKEKGFKHWMKYKLGKKPVLLDEEILKKVNLTFENRLYHKGHFMARSDYTIKKNKKTARIQFSVAANAAYRIDTVIFPDPQDTISKIINQERPLSLLKKGEVYNLDLLKAERCRIENELRNRGFYYFNEEYILFKVDTNFHQNVKIKLEIKEDAPQIARRIYTIDKVYVAEDYRVHDYHPDTTQIGNYNVISSTQYMKPKIFLNSVLYEKNDIYSKNSHNNSMRQLMGLRTYKFTNIYYTPSLLSDNKLDVTYTLTPSKKMLVTSEVNVVGKSNNFAGPGLRLSFSSRNFFRGAELFTINLGGRFEQQINGEDQGDTAYEVSVDASLDLPRLFPFKWKKRNVPFIPSTNISIGTGVYARVSLYKFNTISTGLEYSWRKNDFLTHVFKPIDISITNLLESTAEFKEFLFLNPSIRKSFEEQFIIGFSYNFIINKLDEKYPSQYYLNAGIDPSGNIISMLHNLVRDKETDGPLTILGTPISQYFRVRADFRYYFRVGKKSKLATRIYSGVGVPYGNSTVMPYIKQFFSGGTNSVRAFRARTLGPGTYKPPDSLQNVLVDQTGEIKIEANVEYRFPIVGILKGAGFIDVGNIWLVNEDSVRPGGKFQLEKFHKELGVGAGFGLRLDVNLMVIRLDWAFPIRKPWLPEGNRWIFDDIDLLNARWRRENMIWNISIGYPF